MDVDFPEVWRAVAGLDQIAHGGADRNEPAPVSDSASSKSPPHGGADRNPVRRWGMDRAAGRRLASQIDVIEQGKV